MSGVKSIAPVVALSLADRLFSKRPEEVIEQGEAKPDLAVYGEVKYNLENDGCVHIVFPQTVPFEAMQERSNAKRTAFVTVKAPQVELNVEKTKEDGTTVASVLFTTPVEFDLRFKFKD